MTRRMILSIASSGLILLAGSLPAFETLSYGEFPPASEKAGTSFSASDIGNGEEDCLNEVVNLPEANPAADEWPGAGSVGGDVAPVRSILDPYPTFDGIAVDTQNNKVVMSDENRHCLLVYDRSSGNMSDDMTQPARQILGPQTKLGFCAGVALDPVEHQAYTVNNDGGDLKTAFSYDSNGDLKT